MNLLPAIGFGVLLSTSSLSALAAGQMNSKGQIAGVVNIGDHQGFFMWSQEAGRIVVDTPYKGFMDQVLINDQGQIAGTASDHPFLWSQATGFVELIVPEGTIEAEVFGLNNSGRSTGYFCVARDKCYGGLWGPRGDLLRIETGNKLTVGFAINDKDQVVLWAGSEDPFESQTLLWTSSSGAVPVSWQNVDFINFAINRSGQILNERFFWSEETGEIPFGESDSARAMNEAGQVVGRSSRTGRGFFWTSTDGMRDLGDLGTTAYDVAPEAINNKGHVVGNIWETALGIPAPFIWTLQDGMKRLLDHQENGDSYNAKTINDAGQVFGEMSIGNGRHAFFWSESTGILDAGPIDGALD